MVSLSTSSLLSLLKTPECKRQTLRLTIWAVFTHRYSLRVKNITNICLWPKQTAHGTLSLLTLPDLCYQALLIFYKPFYSSIGFAPVCWMSANDSWSELCSDTIPKIFESSGSESFLFSLGVRYLWWTPAQKQICSHVYILISTLCSCRVGPEVDISSHRQVLQKFGVILTGSVTSPWLCCVGIVKSEVLSTEETPRSFSSSLSFATNTSPVKGSANTRCDLVSAFCNKHSKPALTSCLKQCWGEEASSRVEQKLLCGGALLSCGSIAAYMLPASFVMASISLLNNRAVTRNTVWVSLWRQPAKAFCR